MSANTVWRPKSTETLSQLIKNLEAQGCELTDFEKVRSNGSLTLFMPGLDVFVFTFISIPEPWMTSVRACLWDRAELKFSRDDQSIQCRWIYWSPIQVFIHAAIWGIFLLKIFTLSDATFYNLSILLLGCGILNALAFLLSRREQDRLNSLFLASGFVSPPQFDG
jgi:hypothetical protein